VLSRLLWNNVGVHTSVTLCPSVEYSTVKYVSELTHPPPGMYLQKIGPTKMGKLAFVEEIKRTEVIFSHGFFISVRKFRVFRVMV
jgi:hypothetical protein